MAQPRLPLVINGIDFSTAVNRTGYVVAYEERTGRNTFISLSGDEDLDILAKKPVITWPLNALWSDELAQLESAISASTYVPVSYFDAIANAEQTAYFHGIIDRAPAQLVSERGIMFYGGILTLRAR